MLNTYPCNPFPISSEQLHKGDNEDLQAQINAIKDGSVIDSFGDVETALDTKTDNDVIAPEFDAEAGTYEIGDLVMYEGKLYEFTSAHETAGEWDPTEVTETTVGDELSSLESGLTNVSKTVLHYSIDANTPFVLDLSDIGSYTLLFAFSHPYGSSSGSVGLYLASNGFTAGYGVSAVLNSTDITINKTGQKEFTITSTKSTLLTVIGGTP